MDAILELKNVTKRFGGLTAVSGVSFALRRGEMLGLIGPNGAGKSTLVNLISGEMPSSAGEIWFEGRRVNGLMPNRLCHAGIARTFQTPRLWGSMTVLQNVAVAVLYGRPAPPRALAAVREESLRSLEFTGLADLAERPARELNLSQAKRLQVARALASQPRVLLLDEAMGGLSTREIGEAMELVQKARDSGVSVLVIEHLMRVIMRLSDRIIVLHHGELIADDQPEAVRENPAVIAAYFGERYRRRLGGVS